MRLQDSHPRLCTKAGLGPRIIQKIHANHWLSALDYADQPSREREPLAPSEDVSMGGFYIDNGSGLKAAYFGADPGGAVVGCLSSPRNAGVYIDTSYCGRGWHDGSAFTGGSPVAGQAHVKTGLLQDVRAMAGYMLTANPPVGFRIITTTQRLLIRGGVGTVSAEFRPLALSSHRALLLKCLVSFLSIRSR